MKFLRTRELNHVEKFEFLEELQKNLKELSDYVGFLKHTNPNIRFQDRTIMRIRFSQLQTLLGIEKGE